MSDAIDDGDDGDQLPAPAPAPRQVNGRPRHIPSAASRERVVISSGLGIPNDQVAAILGISLATLIKYYESDIRLGRAKASAEIADSLFNKAKNGDTAALIWWTKAQMKWTETQRHENTGSDGGPVEIVIKWSEGK
jgi:hypothetical protein